MTIYEFSVAGRHPCLPQGPHTTGVGAIRMFTQLMMRRSAMCLALGLLFGTAFAWTSVMSQATRAQLTSAESEGKSVKGDKQGGES